MRKYDVAVCGGGFAGISAALAAARQGKRVILFEKEHNESAWKEIFKDFLHTFLNLEISI